MDNKRELDALREKVAKNTDVIKSAVDLIKGFKARLEECLAHGEGDGGSDISMEVKALADELGSQTDALAAAVAENTDAGPVEDDGEDDGGGEDGGDDGGEGGGDVEPVPSEPSEPSDPAEPEPSNPDEFETPRDGEPVL